MRNMLTICIPTYNRPQKLEQQLRALVAQGLDGVLEIIVLDNASDYDLEDILKKIGCEKISLMRRRFNVGMGINLVMPLLFVRSNWLWVLSDDDEVMPNAVNSILKEIGKASSQTAMIKFARDGVFNKPARVKSLEEFVDYYYFEKSVRRGDLVFISTAVINVDVISKHVTDAFAYSYSLLGCLVAVLSALDKGKANVVFVDTNLVRYCPPDGDGWCHLKESEKLSTLTHLPFDLDRKYWRRFLDVMMPLSWKSLLIESASSDGYADRKSILHAYHGIYRFYLPFYERVSFFIFYYGISTRIGSVAMKEFIRLFRTVKGMRS